MLSALLLLVTQLPAGGTSVIATNSLLTVPVGGLERTNATSAIIGVTGQPFSKALRVTVRRNSTETNWTQLTIPNAVPVQKGDALLASFWLRGTAADGRDPGRIEFLFEKSTDPWTKSVSQVASAGKAWKQYLIPFSSSALYRPGEAMVSLRFAHGPQTVEVGGLSVIDYGKTRSFDQLQRFVISKNPLGLAKVQVDFKARRQTMMGLGGNFCQPRYGSSEPMDAVGDYNLKHLNVVHARVGFPMNSFNPQPGVFTDDGPAHASLLLLQQLSRRKIPLVSTVWEGPQWMLGGDREQSGRVLDPSRYKDCIEAIVRYLVLARDRYGVGVDYFSFNEPDYGVNFKFTPRTMIDFIAQAGPELKARGLKTKFLVADTANGTNTYDFARPILEDPTVRPYLGPLAFHCWDALGASDVSYRKIAELGKRFNKRVWCLEAGHDAGLWQAPNPWVSWDNGLRTALAYIRTLNLTEASLMDYWTYQDNYPLVDRSRRPYPVWRVMKQMEWVFAPGSTVVQTTTGSPDLKSIATVGPTKNRFSVLLANPIGSGTVRLSGLPKGARVLVQISDERRQLQTDHRDRVDSKGQISVNIPLRSVVSVVAG